jgi:hypothetical protein
MAGRLKRESAFEEDILENRSRSVHDNDPEQADLCTSTRAKFPTVVYVTAKALEMRAQTSYLHRTTIPIR